MDSTVVSHFWNVFIVSLFSIRCEDLKGGDLSDKVEVAVVPELSEFEFKELLEDEENEADLRNLCC